MTIPAEDLVKIDQDLTKITTKAYDYYAAVAKDDLPPVAIDLNQLLRKSTPLIVVTSGGSADDLNCAVYDSFIINATGTSALTLNLQNITEGDTRTQIIVNRAVPNVQTITFTGTGLVKVIEGENQGISTLYFQVWKGDGGIIVTQVNNQSSDSLIGGNLTSSDGTISLFNYFKSTTNNNICSFESSFTFTTTGLHNSLDIDIANWDVTKFNTGYTSMSVECEVSGVPVKIRGARIKEDSMRIVLDAGVTDGDVVIILNGSFRIK